MDVLRGFFFLYCVIWQYSCSYKIVLFYTHRNSNFFYIRSSRIRIQNFQNRIRCKIEWIRYAKLQCYLERAVLDCAGADKSDNDGHDVDGELELQELRDGVVHVPAPHHRLHYTREVIVGKDDVRGLLGHVCAGYPHGETNVGLLKSRGVVCPVTCDGDHLPGSRDVAVDDSLDERVLVDGLGTSENP